MLMCMGNWIPKIQVQFCSALNCCQEARKFARLDDEDCEVGRNRHVLYDTYTIDDDEIELGLTVNNFHNHENESEISDITGAQVLLSLEGISQKGVITGKKHNIDGNTIGDTQETTEYIVEFPD